MHRVTNDPKVIEAFKTAPRQHVTASAFADDGTHVLLMLADGTTAVLTKDMLGSIAGLYLQMFDKPGSGS